MRTLSTSIRRSPGPSSRPWWPANSSAYRSHHCFTKPWCFSQNTAPKPLRGAASSVGGEVTAYRSRRGIEQTLFRLTVVLAVLFVAFSLLNLLDFA